jgi:hypothetical protein
MPVKAQTQCQGDNPIQEENCLQGTADWQIPLTPGKNPPFPSGNDGHEVEGYSNKVSVTAGEQIRFHLSSRAGTQTIRIDIYRLGYYSGLGARFITTKDVTGVEPGPLPTPDLTAGRPAENAGMGLAECNWPSQTNAYWDVPSTATSGIYLAKLTGLTYQYQSYISFAVRRDDLNSDLLFQQSVTVYQAYNDYPGAVFTPYSDSRNGKSLYGSPGATIAGSTQARKVSFNRPYIGYSPFTIYESAGLGFFNFEYPLIRWLEKKGFDVTYATDIDTHNDSPTSPSLLAAGKHKALLSNGHDEYWSWEMRNNVERARDRTSQPLNLGFFGGNISYWQIRLTNSNSTGTQPANAANRTIVCYKENYGVPDNQDPYYYDANHALHYKTSFWWRDQQILKPAGTSFYPASVYFQPEDEMLGIMTIRSGGDDEHPGSVHFNPIFGGGSNNFVLNTEITLPSWLTNGTVGQTMTNMIGYESDELYPNHYSGTNAYTNRTLTIIGSSPFYATRPSNGINSTCSCGDPDGCSCVSYNLGNAETTFYRKTDSGAKVFAASGQQWSWGLDNWGANSDVGLPTVRPSSATADASKITENVINCLINQVSACNQ